MSSTSARFPVAILTSLLVSSLVPLAAQPQEGTTREEGAFRFDRLHQAEFTFGGRIGERVERNVDAWLLTAPIANPGMLNMFRVRDRKPPPSLVPWAGEFVGKYLISAVQALRMTDRPDAQRFVRGVVQDLLSTQAADGYLGPFPREERLLGHWDLWGHYHVILALLLWHERTGDESALEAAFRAGDLICRTYLDTGRRVYDAGSHEMNMAIIHALGKLYRLSGSGRYLRLMREIEEDWKRAGDYFRQGLAGVEFFRTPRPRWESLHDIQGLVELYRITGDEAYRRAFINLWTSIRRRDRHNTGGFSSGEQAVGHPYSPAAIETCCTVAWMALTEDMLRLTGDSTAADELELATFNAAAGAQHPSGRWWTYNTPMDGVREASAHSIVFQARAGTPELNCCSVNAPRGLGILSEWAVMRSDDGLVVNYYGPGRVTIPRADGSPEIVLQQDPERTTYPAGGDVLLRVLPAEPREFELKLRIPGWSRKTEARVNGEVVPEARAGTYLAIRRIWRRGDTVSLHFDMRLRVWTGDRDAAGKISIFRGPLLLAYDQRWNQFDEDGIPVLDAAEVQGLSVAPSNPREADSRGDSLPRVHALEPWILLGLEGVDGRKLTLCDFATAGALGTRYRSWLVARNRQPPQVLLDRPADGGAIGPGRALFTWSGFRPRSRAASFRLLISTRNDFSGVVVNEECRRNVHVPERSFSAETTYFWKVIAVDEGGETGSEVRSFRVDPAREAATARELEAWLPDANGVLVAASLRGNPEPDRGLLQDVRGAQAAEGPRNAPGGAIAVDGRTGRLRYRVPYFPSEEYTAGLWVNIRSFPEGRLGQVFSAWAAGMDDPLRICVAGRELFARIEAGQAYSTGGASVETGRWMHVAAVKDGTRLRLYIDGKPVGSATVPASVMSSAQNVALGANPNFGGNEYLDVALAGFRLYARALPPEEVRELANAEPGTTKPLIVKRGTIDLDLVETTPVVFRGRLYRFEYVRKGYRKNTTGDSYFRFVDMETGEPTPGFARGYHLGSAFVDGDTVYVTGTDTWGGHRVEMFSSNDLETWRSRTALDLSRFEIFNTSMCRADDRYVMMFEIGGPPEEAGQRFTARFAESKDLEEWRLTPPECVYARDRYTAPHCLRYLRGYFYDFYLEAHDGYEMRVVRSRDLVEWESSPLNPVLRHSPEDKKIANPKLTAEEREIIRNAENLNNSDIDFCEYEGRTVILYSWGNQRGTEFLAEACYEGGVESFLEGFFPES